MENNRSHYEFKEIMLPTKKERLIGEFSYGATSVVALMLFFLGVGLSQSVITLTLATAIIPAITSVFAFKLGKRFYNNKIKNRALFSIYQPLWNLDLDKVERALDASKRTGDDRGLEQQVADFLSNYDRKRKMIREIEIGEKNYERFMKKNNVEETILKYENILKDMRENNEKQNNITKIQKQENKLNLANAIKEKTKIKNTPKIRK